MQSIRSGKCGDLVKGIALSVFTMVLPWQAAAQSQYTPDPGCSSGQAWLLQTDERTDPTGKNNIDFPLQQATYWATQLTGSNRAEVTIHGQFPAARYMALQVYDYNRNVLGAIRDSSDVTAGTSNPVLPIVTAGGVTMPTCAARPIINPATATVWGRLDQNNFAGVKPAITLPALNPPLWRLSTTNSSTQFFPSQDNSYMDTILSRRYLSAPFKNDLVVMRMRAPTFADTQSGVPPYADTDVRFWSICTNEAISTGVTRCITDDQALNVNGFVTFVISDPNRKPSSETLSQWGAQWIAWGALAPGDSIYDAQENLLTNADGAFYYSRLNYRQTVTNPAFAASILNVSALPLDEEKITMGDYWPTVGYCSLQDFEALGPNCVNPRQ